jgi:SOS-response transcriptional repressor LexA/DNA-binding XRE family transcriptional regulator
MSNIQQRIVELRKSLGVKTQSLFAGILDINRTTLIGYENGTSPPSVEFLSKLRKIYNVNVNWLIDGGGEMFLGSPERSPETLEKLSPGALIDRRLEKIETQIAENIEKRLSRVENRLEKSGMFPSEGPRPDLHAFEPEPEYGGGRKEILFVDNVAAGRPIYQSDDRSIYIKVPGRLIKTSPKDYYAARIRGTSMVMAGIPDGCLALFSVSDTPRDGAIQIVAYRGEATVKRMREVPGEGWKICFEDGSGKVLDIHPGQEFRIQGDFVAVLPEGE